MMRPSYPPCLCTMAWCKWSFRYDLEGIVVFCGLGELCETKCDYYYFFPTRGQAGMGFQ